MMNMATPEQPVDGRGPVIVSLNRALRHAFTSNHDASFAMAFRYPTRGRLIAGTAPASTTAARVRTGRRNTWAVARQAHQRCAILYRCSRAHCTMSESSQRQQARLAKGATAMPD